MWYNGFWGFPWLGIIFLVIILFWIFSGKRHWHHWDRRDYQAGAKEILSEKYVKGEITEKEYKEKLDVLRKHSQ